MADDIEQIRTAVANEVHITKWAQFGEEIKSVHNCVERLEKKKKDFQLVLVVGKFRIWVFLKEKKNKLKMVREFHLYDIESLIRKEDQITIAYKGQAKQNKLTVTCSTATAAIKSIRESFARIACGFPPTYFQYEDSSGSTQVDPYEPDLETKMINNYIGQCSYYQVLSNKEIVYYLRDMVENRSIELDLSCVPVIEDDPDKAPMLELKALIASLRYDTHFRSIIAADTPQPSIISMVAYVLQTNTTLTKIVLSNLNGGEQQIIEIVEALKKNSLHAVQILDLSGNNISLKAATELAKVFQGYRHVLLELDLSNCSLSPKAVQLIFQAFIENPSTSLSINVLNMSNNKFELIGSQELERWFFTLKVYSKLRHLLLSGCSLSLQVLQSLKHMAELVELDLSNNKIDSAASFVLSSFMEVSPAISYLNLASCGLSYDAGAKSIFSSLARNPKAINCTIDFSDNPDLKLAIHKDLPADASKISSLDLTGIKMKDATWIELIQAVGKLNMLHTINLSDTLSRSGAQSPVIQALSGLVQSCPNITTLKLSNGFGKRVLIPFLEAFNNSIALTSLDISSNAMGDSGAAAVGTMLTTNTSLKHIAMDRNGTKTNGFLALLSAFITNKTLSKLEIEDDAQRELSVLTGKPKERFSNVLLSLQTAVFRNSPPQLSIWHPTMRRTFPRSVETPIDIVPFPPMPVHLQSQQSGLSINDAGAVTASIAAVATTTIRNNPTLRAPPPLVAQHSEPTSSAPPCPPPPPRLNLPPPIPSKQSEPEPEAEAEVEAGSDQEGNGEPPAGDGEESDNSYCSD